MPLNMVKWASIKTSTKVRGYVPSAEILGGTELNVKSPEILVFLMCLVFVGFPRGIVGSGVKC